MNITKEELKELITEAVHEAHKCHFSEEERVMVSQFTRDVKKVRGGVLMSVVALFFGGITWGIKIIFEHFKT